MKSLMFVIGLFCTLSLTYSSEKVYDQILSMGQRLSALKVQSLKAPLLEEMKEDSFYVSKIIEVIENSMTKAIANRLFTIKCNVEEFGLPEDFEETEKIAFFKSVFPPKLAEIFLGTSELPLPEQTEKTLEVWMMEIGKSVKNLLSQSPDLKVEEIEGRGNKFSVTIR